MADEIERRFLVASMPALDELGPGDELRQGYLAIDGTVEVRVRRTGAHAGLTVKAGTGLVRTEVELPLTPGDAEALWELTDGRRIEKVRRRVALAPDLDAEVDTYGAALAGLCTVEVEFPDLAAAEGFRPPDWFGRELTGERGWSNAALACHGVPGQGGARMPRPPGGQSVG